APVAPPLSGFGPRTDTSLEEGIGRASMRHAAADIAPAASQGAPLPTTRARQVANQQAATLSGRVELRRRTEPPPRARLDTRLDDLASVPSEKIAFRHRLGK